MYYDIDANTAVLTYRNPCGERRENDKFVCSCLDCEMLLYQFSSMICTDITTATTAVSGTAVAACCRLPNTAGSQFAWCRYTVAATAAGRSLQNCRAPYRVRLQQ